MKTHRRLVLVSILTGLFGRASGAPREVRSVGEDGWVDLDFPLTDFSRRSGEFRAVAKGDFRGASVGFLADIGNDWKAKPTDDGTVTFFWGSVTIRSIGGESDAFVNAYARLLGHSKPDIRMLPSINALAVGLANDPRLVEQRPTKMKLFFHSDIEERYAEVFLNVDRPGKTVQLHEKDPEYRLNLIRALTETA
jgi:hypothetical protein